MAEEIKLEEQLTETPLPGTQDGADSPQAAEDSAETGAETGADMAPEASEAPATRRASFTARMRERYPDRNLDDEEELFGAISDGYDELETSNNEYRDNNRKLVDLFRNDERSARFLTGWANGKDPIVSLIENYGDLFREALEDPEKVKEIAEANRRFAENAAEQAAQQKAREENLQQSLMELSALQEEEGISDEQIDEAMTLFIRMADDLTQGKFTREDVKVMLNALNYDSAVSEARDEGELTGRNAKIEETWRRKKGDGLPTLGGGGQKESEGLESASIFELANQAK